MDGILGRIALFAGNGVMKDSSAKAKLPTASLKHIPQYKYVENSAHVTGTYPKDVGILCFSKDRPFQLEQFLISTTEFIDSGEHSTKIVVLYSPGTRMIF